MREIAGTHCRGRKHQEYIGHVRNLVELVQLDSVVDFLHQLHGDDAVGGAHQSHHEIQQCLSVQLHLR